MTTCPASILRQRGWKHSLALHLTDYFIWSNKASSTQGNKASDAAYSSPNFFVAQAAEHMDAEVSPYLAFLTEMHAKIAAMEPPVVNKIQGVGSYSRRPEHLSRPKRQPDVRG